MIVLAIIIIIVIVGFGYTFDFHYKSIFIIIIVIIVIATHTRSPIYMVLDVLFDVTYKCISHMSPGTRACLGADCVTYLPSLLNTP